MLQPFRLQFMAESLCTSKPPTPSPLHPRKDNGVIDLAGEGEWTGGDYSLGEGGGGGIGGTADVAPGLHEAKAPLGPPVGADAEATRLSDTISVKLPDEGESPERIVIGV